MRTIFNRERWKKKNEKKKEKKRRGAKNSLRTVVKYVENIHVLSVL